MIRLLCRFPAIRHLCRLGRLAPFDGEALVPGGSSAERRRRRFAADAAWSRRPPRYRRLLQVPARLVWLAVCPLRAMLRTRRRHWGAAIRVGYTRGKDPAEAVLHRAVAATADAADAIPGERQNALLWQALGDRADIALCSDKLETAARLAALGLPVPPLLAELRPGAFPAADAPLWGEGRLFVKARHGSASRNVGSLIRLPDRRFLIDGVRLTGGAGLLEWLAALAGDDTVLVQPFLAPHPDLRDLAPRAPAVVRVFTVHLPDGPPRAHSGLLKCLLPGADAPADTEALLIAPIDPGTGRLLAGLTLPQPERRVAVVPWGAGGAGGGGIVEGRRLELWPAVADLAVRASALMPGLPIVGWDVLLSDRGPVILEANSGVSWFRADLWHLMTGTPSPLPELMAAWCRHRGGAPRGARESTASRFDSRKA